MVRILILISSFFSFFEHASSQNMQEPVYTYLALGDSYTIGEGIPEQDNFPGQTVKLLYNAGYIFQKPVIIAKTGWTTDELETAISKASLQERYSFVSLLIGVNNQYRGRSLEEYTKDFERLLLTAIHFAGKKPAHVFVLSIPDWSVTPFAEGRERKLISMEIDKFNNINRSIAEKWKVKYIEITSGTREAAEDQSLIASDGLHPSAKEYERWAEKLAAGIKQELQ